jgi:phospholipase C
VNGLSGALLAHNPNGRNPVRLDRSQAFTCDNDHSYRGEQLAFDGTRMDRFTHVQVEDGGQRCLTSTMDYYDGNTVTALWNYAQRFSMSDNSRDVTFGPTGVGHLNLVAGQTHGALVTGSSPNVVDGTVVGNVAAQFDDCGPRTGPRLAMTGRNIGDLLGARGISWGYFSEGFRASARSIDGIAICGSAHATLAGTVEDDYYPGAIAEPFQFWASTANPHHLPPAAVSEIGHAGRANHQYDLSDFWDAADSGNEPAVSFLKPAVYDNGHAHTSDPLDEQRFLVDTVNRLQRLPTWASTAVVIAYDDSDGWYDHAPVTITNSSAVPTLDGLDGAGRCGSGRPLNAYEGRCGPGPRQPLLILSPYARRNFVDHTPTTQASILRFIEDNWLNHERIGDGSFDATAGTLEGMFDFAHPDPRLLMLDPGTGEPSTSHRETFRNGGGIR